METSDELAALRAMGTDQLQGFLLGRPVGPLGFEAWIRDHATPPATAPLHQ